MRRKILFVAEAITLAQVVRLVTLASRLDRSRYEIHFAAGEFDPVCFAHTDFTHWPLVTIDKRAGLASVEKGERIYDQKTLARYADAELALFDRVKPDVVVGDFRLSLAVSAPRASLPCLSLINAYWSPFAVRDGFPVPDHPIVRLVGPELAARYFPQALPKVFAHFAAPLNALRERHGLPPFASLLEQLCFGDVVLYPDVPSLCPLAGAPPTHHYLGGVQWAPDVPLPAWWESVVASPEPLVYVTLGSSGSLEALPTVLAGLEGLPLNAVLSTAGRTSVKSLPSNVRVAELLPADRILPHARFAITNGGSTSGYQALASGVPVLGIPSNLDQYLAQTAIERSGAGLLLRSGGLTPAAVRKAAVQMLDAPAKTRAARTLAAEFAGFDCHAAFGHILDSVFDSSSTAGRSA